MVTEALIGFFMQAIRAVVRILPVWSPPAEDLTAVSTEVGAWGARADGYFPVTVLGVCLAVVFAVKVGLLAWRVVVFIYHQFWGSD